MVKIISRKLLKTEKVYDIGVEKDHNFLLSNGLIASNCFNKSHSTAYAYITYQTAYLKANYPVEYMTALLTASSDNQDKIEAYRESCKKLGIEVIPPDINQCEKEFVPIPNTRKILYGLSAVKNLGENAIDNILQARKEAEGSFKSLADFCVRVKLGTVNHRSLETLIYTGAFDSINPNRKQLIEYLDVVIKWAHNRLQEKETGQLNIFDSVEEDTNTINFDDAPSLPNVEDFSIQEKLKLEKEYIGFYISQHPLQFIQKASQLLSPTNLNELAEKKQNFKVTVVVILSLVKKHITKKGEGEEMAYLHMEDISGDFKGVVFPKTYSKLKDHLITDIPLVIRGKVDKREKLQLIVDDIESVDKVKILMIELSIQEALDINKQANLKSLLEEHSGEKDKCKFPVIAIITNGIHREFVLFSQEFWIQDLVAATNSLNNAGFRTSGQDLIPSSN